MKQTTFASAAWDRKGKVTRRERFLAEMDAVIPWARLLKLIEPHYPKAGNGTQPMPMERMLRIYFMQNWFNLSDPAAEDSLYDSESMRRFAGIELVEDAVPDETTILRFRHLLERHQLTERIFTEIRSLLEEKRLLLRSGTIVDATIIEAPPSTKNEQKARDPEMRQGKKGGGWHFGMKKRTSVPTCTAGCTPWRRLMRVRPTLANCPSCCTEMNERCTGIKPTGARIIARRPRRAASATASTADPPTPIIRSPRTNVRSTAADRAHGLAANTPFTSSNVFGALPKCVTAAWPRTQRAFSRPSRWPICIWCGDA